uniref:Uncharacterized protein n=1 Tax=Iconisemion striatum TaxID=60296 RepID=A0A1A7YQM1_9TELE
MKGKVSRLRLSPNEEARIIREEHERRRKLRIQQVRDQQRYIALQIRRKVEQRRQHELQLLEKELRENWEREHKEKLQTLERLYQESLQLVGQGHRSAKENEPDLAAIAQKEEENHAKAEERYREALKELKTQKIRDHERQSRSISARKKALQVEKERSTKVASLPPPPPNPIQNIDVKKPRTVRRFDPSAFATTYHHMTENTIEREAEVIQFNAHEEAQLEARRLQDLQEEENRRREEQLEKAHLRGRQALRREHLVQDRERLLVELEHLQQTDLLRRRQQVSQMPPQIFQPLYKRQETREDFQREMEFAFEDMYTGERRVKGDLVVQLVPEPLPAPSASSHDQELDVTVDETAVPETESVQNDSEQEVGSSEKETSAEVEVEPSKPAPRRALRKLLDRIRSQRDEWINNGSRDSAADSPIIFTELIPDRDTTIESGSLPSEEKDKQAPIEVRDSTVPPPGLEPINPPDRLLPDHLVGTIHEFEEQKKREEDLEREKQQQLFLLQELEEQKAKLEQMLLEAQQERERLKAAVTQEAAFNQPEAHVGNQEFSPGSAIESVPPAGEDDHTRRIREYQHRLLEQNRVHQRSVEVARQRLEEYQRALQIRHNMSSRSFFPGVIQPPLRGFNPPAPLHLHATPAGPPNAQDQTQIFTNFAERDSEMSSSPPRPASSSSKFLLDESASNTLKMQRSDVSDQLTDSIMKRVTEHLPERLRPSPVSKEQLFTAHDSTSSQSTSDQVRVSSPSVSSGAPLDPGLQPVSLFSREDGMERQKRELQEAQRRVVKQREAVVQQQRLQEEERRRMMVEMEQVRRQKETLQALIKTDEQHVSDPPSERLQSEEVGQNRLRLLASLLRTIEESNGGSLSHLEEPEDMDDPSQPTQLDPVQGGVPLGPPRISDFPSGLFHPPRALKPPVTRMKVGFKGIMEPHELSVIQEVETPVDISQVADPEDVNICSCAADSNLQEESVSFVSSDETPSVCSSGQRAAERRVASATSSHLVWRDRLLSGAGSPPGASDSVSILKTMSPLSSDSGRGADFSGPANASYRSPTEALSSSPRSECLSTTISSGSYVTTDPEQNVNTDKYLSFKLISGADSSGVSSPPGPPLSTEENSPAGRSALFAVFNDRSIQSIIDKYTKELDESLSAAGTAAGRRMEDEISTGHLSLLSHSAGTQSVLEHFPAEASSLTEDHAQGSFRPLIGHLTDQSSCLAADQRELALEQLVGQPSAHSSVIGHLPGTSASPSFDRGGWDSTLSRMIGRLSHLSSSHWMSPGEDFTAGQQMGQMLAESSLLLEESQMRPLAEELDESADQHNRNSGEEHHMAVGVSLEDGVPSPGTSLSEASSHSTPVPDMNQHLQELPSPGNRAEEDSFHPLPAEITHNEMADLSMTFHFPEHNLSDVPDGLPSQHEVSTPYSSPEQLRIEDPNCCVASSSLHGSFSQLVISEHHPQDSVLTVSPHLKTNVEQNCCTLSNLTTRGDGDAPDPETAESVAVTSDENEKWGDSPASDEILTSACERGILEQSEITLVSLTNTIQDEEEENSSEETRTDNHEDQEMTGLQSTSLYEETPAEDCQTLPVTVLEFEWGPSEDLQDVFQQRRAALLLRSNRRVEEIKAKGACAKSQPERRAPYKGGKSVKASRGLPIRCEAKATPEPQQETENQAKTQVQPQVRDFSLKNVKIYSPEQRKRNLSEMHKRTQRLYEQLEEVKQQKTIRSRQEDYAKNRMKAKEFHKKTLQKLRAQQTRQ